MSNIRIGLFGCGVVGQGVMRLLHEHAANIEGRLGSSIEVRRVVVRDLARERGPHVDRAILSSDPDSILNDPEIDVVVEVMGGLDHAEQIVRRALADGKAVVTANKALLAERGTGLFDLAATKGLDLYFEAAVAGGVPVIRVLREALTSDRVASLRGIVNGTSNYILSRMQDADLDFDAALKEAQELGFAEADPTLDVGGGDAAHKLTILANLAFGTHVALQELPIEGIDTVTATDMQFAKRFGFTIKPLAVARQLTDGSLDLRVHPALVGRTKVLASISGALNAVYIEGAALGPCMLSGLGAGALPTAVSVVSDIVDVGRNLLAQAGGRVKPQVQPHADSEQPRVRSILEHHCRFYLRFSVRDQSGVLGELASVLGAHRVSIEQMVQEGHGQDEPVSVVILTHPALEGDIRTALATIDALPSVFSPTRALRIEEG